MNTDTTNDPTTTTTSPVKPATWHYWVAFNTRVGSGAVDMIREAPLTTADQVVGMQEYIRTLGVPDALVMSWILLRTDPAVTADDDPMTTPVPTPAQLTQAVHRLRAAHAVADTALDDEHADRQVIAETLMAQITGALKVFTSVLGERP